MEAFLTNMQSLWTALTTGISSMATSIGANEYLMLFVFGIPLISIGVGIFLKLIGKRRGRRR